MTDEPQPSHLGIDTSYEVAIDVLNQLIGYAANQSFSGKRTPDADPEAVADWGRRRDEWAARRNALRPDDLAGIFRVLDEDAPVLRSLRP